MSKTRLVVTAVLIEGRSKSEVARDYGVSRRWVQTLVARYQAEGDVGLEPRSRRPHRSPQQIDRDTEDRIIALRKDLTDLGLDAGAATIAAHLEREHGNSPSVATIWRVLRGESDHGRVRIRGRPSPLRHRPLHAHLLRTRGTLQAQRGRASGASGQA